MRRCILHVGSPKTGTTSIQSSLLYAPRDRRFRLLTLDSDFGNFLVSSAFRVDFGGGDGLVSVGIDSRRAAAAGARSRRHLDRALAASARHGATPILSAETMLGFDEESLVGLRDFLRARGWSPQVVAYLRPPFDYLASLLGQAIRANLWFVREPEFGAFCTRFDPIGRIRRLDGVFGPEAVMLHWFEPSAFPGGCVVRHFCESTGIGVPIHAVARENDSLNLSALRFLYAMIAEGRGRGATLASRARWRTLVERLAGVPGPPLRLHESLTTPVGDRLRPDWGWLESRLGRPLPMSTRAAGPEEGVRSREDLLDFSDESLRWLAEAVDRPVVRPGRGQDTVRETVDQLRRLDAVRSPKVVLSLGRSFARERWHRMVGKLRNQW